MEGRKTKKKINYIMSGIDMYYEEEGDGIKSDGICMC